MNWTPLKFLLLQLVSNVCEASVASVFQPYNFEISQSYLKMFAIFN